MSKDRKRNAPPEKASNTDTVRANGHASAKIIHTVQDRGASYAISLEAAASAKLLEKKRGITGRISSEQKRLAGNILKALGCEGLGLSITLESGIPPKAGLGEDEAASVAIALAVSGAVAKKHGSVNELRIDKYVREQYMVVGEKLVDKKKLLDLCPGEFDRLFVSLYGGFSVCDNRRKEVCAGGRWRPWRSSSPSRQSGKNRQKTHTELPLRSRPYMG